MLERIYSKRKAFSPCGRGSTLKGLLLVYSRRKDFFPTRDKFYPLRVDPFSEGIVANPFLLEKTGSKFFPFTVDLFSEGGGKAFNESVSIPRNCYGLRSQSVNAPKAFEPAHEKPTRPV